jgi:hypothetical protein
VGTLVVGVVVLYVIVIVALTNSQPAYY